MYVVGQTDDRGEPQERIRRGEPGPHAVHHLLTEGRGGGLPNIARLFRAVAYAERVHASNHYRNIRTKGDAVTVSMAGFGSRTTMTEDLQIGIDGENFEVNEMYPVYLEVAHMQKEYAAEISFRYAWEAEKIHAAFYQRAKEAADSGKNLDLGPVCVCSVCGYTVEGEAPDSCPICKAKKEKFRIIAA